MKKKKIIVISDHALSHSGVATQTKFLIEGLIKKGDMTFRQLGAAVRHDDYDIVKVNDDFFIKPVDGFGDTNLIRNILLNEKPDAIIIFNDPRFFEYLFLIEEEVRSICPILWWHVWDNYPFPEFNMWMYESVDRIVCHSHLTYQMYKERGLKNISYIPHAIPKDTFFKMKDKLIKEKRKSILKNKKDWFVTLWLNRNIKRKRPGDLLFAYKKFIDNVYKNYNHKNCLMIMHTDPLDKAGLNLLEISRFLNIEDNIIFSDSKIKFEEMNILHNISDCCINISYNEGFGLSTLQSLQTGTPIISVKTGGQTRQVIDHNNGFEHGVGIDVDFKIINGNQDVHYIYEDYTSIDNISKAIMNFYIKSKNEKEKIKSKCLKYVDKNFLYQKTVDMWYKEIIESINNNNIERQISLEEI